MSLLLPIPRDLVVHFVWNDAVRPTSFFFILFWAKEKNDDTDRALKHFNETVFPPSLERRYGRLIQVLLSPEKKGWVQKSKYGSLIVGNKAGYTA